MFHSRRMAEANILNINKYMFITLLVLTLILIVLMFFVKLDKIYEPMDSQYNLGLLVTAKNEGMVLKEFLEHYFWQGVEQIYFIDNGSTDDTKEVIAPYIQERKVQYFYLPDRHQQEKHYNEVYNSVARKECKWLIICDVDEYIYNRKKGSNLKDYVSSLDYDKVSSIMLKWKMFGSSNFDKQPKEIRKSFLYRKQDLDDNIKTIINTKFINLLQIHTHKSNDPTAIKVYLPEQLALNHYAIMSKEYFEKIKMTRGAADVIQHENVRHWDYFARYDHKEVYDDELANLL